MTRTTAREIAIQLGFAAVSSKEDISALMERFFSPEHYETLRGENELYAELPDAKQMAYIRRLTELTMENRSEIDGFIERYAKGWKLERISKTALAVMRCAICEILYMDDIPNAAAINEAVEIRAIMSRIPSPLSMAFSAASCGASSGRPCPLRRNPSRAKLLRTSLPGSKPWTSRR